MATKIILLVYWAFCFTLTHVPPSQVPSVGIPYFDKVIHLAMFFGLAIFLSRAYPALARKAFAVLAVLMLYAAIDETTQPPFGREADWFDGLADFSGAVMGWLTYRKMGKRNAYAVPLGKE